MSDNDLEISTQSKIMKLLDDLRNPQKHLRSTKSEELSSTKIKQFKSQMKSKFQKIHQKVETAVLCLNEVQKQANQIVEFKRKLKMNVKYQQDIQEIENVAKQFYTKLEQQKRETSKNILNKILQMKLIEAEQKQRIKHQIQFNKKQLVDQNILRLKKMQSRQQQQLVIPQLQLSTKIKALKRAIQEDSLKNKQHLKSIKNNILEMCDKMEVDIKKQQSFLKQSFDFHYQTIERLVSSISEKIT